MSDLRARLLKALEDNGATDTVNQGLHGWRCEYPESYGKGPCDCVEVLLDDLEAAVSDQSAAFAAAKLEPVAE